MFPNFTSFDITISPDLTIHGVRSATNGPPLLLIHGFPQTHHIWHLVAPHLTSSFTVICIDLPGYGASSKPPSSAAVNHKPYAKSTLAANCVALMDALGYEGRQFGVVGHDRGGRVAHKMCVDFPGRVAACMVLDIAPTLAMFGATDQGFATDYWHWFFLIQAAPFPESAILSSPAAFASRFFGKGALGAELAMHPGARAAYVKQLAEPDAVSSMCEDYRAAATVDLDEARQDASGGRGVSCRLRCLWGAKGVVGRRFDALKEWEAVCVEGGEVSGEKVDCGHYIPEEKPEVVARHVLEFFEGHERARGSLSSS